MKEIIFKDMEKVIGEVIKNEIEELFKNMAENPSIKDALADEITFELFSLQDKEGIKIIGDYPLYRTNKKLIKELEDKIKILRKEIENGKRN